MRKRTRQVFESLCGLTGKLGYTPTMHQIAEDVVPEGRLALNIISDIFYCLQELIEFGLVRRIQVPPRGIYVPLREPTDVDWEELTKGGSDVDA